jgi:hypothetical protein
MLDWEDQIDRPTMRVCTSSMRPRGATHVSLTDCSATPSSHRNCVKPYWDFMLGQLAGLARDR